MKKKITVIAVIACVVLAAFSLAGCKKTEDVPPVNSGNTNPETSASQPETTAASSVTNGVAGEYKLYAVGEGGVFYSADDYAKLMGELMNGLAEAFGGDANQQNEIQNAIDYSDSALTLKEDGTGTMTLFGTKSECTWTEEKGKVVLTITGSENETSTVTGTLEKGVLTLTDPEEGTVMVFAAEGADTSGIELSGIMEALPVK